MLCLSIPSKTSRGLNIYPVLVVVEHKKDHKIYGKTPKSPWHVDAFKLLCGSSVNYITDWPVRFSNSAELTRKWNN